MPPTEEKKSVSEAPKSEGSKDQAAVKEEGSNLDEFGYERVTPETPPKEEKPAGDKGAAGYDEEPVVEDKKAIEEVKEPVSGYDKEPEEVKEKPVEDKKADDKAGASDDFDIKEPGDLLPEDVKELKEFIKKHKVSKEVAQALVEQKKEEAKKIVASIEARKKEAELVAAKYKKAQFEELKADPAFAGDKFAASVKRSEKVIEEFFPNLKKELTKGKGLLPAYIMKDLVKLADHLYETEKLAQGDPVTPKTEDKEANNPLDFYV